MPNFLPVATLTAEDGTDLLQGGLRLRFETISHTQQALGQANFIITNATPALVSSLAEFKKVTLACGYKSGAAPGTIFSGTLTEYQYGEREKNTDPLLRLWAADGDSAYNQAKVSTTLAAGSTPKDIVQKSLQAMQPHGISMGQVVGIDLSQPKFPRGYVLSGMVRDVLREVALSKGATWNLNSGKLNMIGKGAAVPGGPVILNGSTGMIGQPIQRIEGIIVRCLINSAITVDSNVQIDQKSIVQTQVLNADLQNQDGITQNLLASQGVTDGTYRVLRVKANGDTRGGIWEMELTCIGAFTGKTNSVQAGQGLN